MKLTPAEWYAIEQDHYREEESRHKLRAQEHANLYAIISNAPHFRKPDNKPYKSADFLPKKPASAEEIAQKCRAIAAAFANQ